MYVRNVGRATRNVIKIRTEQKGKVEAMIRLLFTEEASYIRRFQPPKSSRHGLQANGERGGLEKRKRAPSTESGPGVAALEH